MSSLNRKLERNVLMKEFKKLRKSDPRFRNVVFADFVKFKKIQDKAVALAKQAQKTVSESDLNQISDMFVESTDNADTTDKQDS